MYQYQALYSTLHWTLHKERSLAKVVLVLLLADKVLLVLVLMAVMRIIVAVTAQEVDATTMVIIMTMVERQYHRAD